jgi:DNA modification methylase
MIESTQPPFCQTDVSGSASVDLFGNQIIKDELLRDKFIEPPFSILDSKSGSWRNRVNKWKRLGLKSDLGRTSMINGKNSQKGYQKIMRQGKHKPHEGVSIFDPALTELIYHWFCPTGGKILDPFAGGSVRGIVANKLGFKYTGVDIRAEQVESNREQALNILEVNNQPQWYCGDSNEVLNTNFNHKFDLIFSCPPYADLEVYSDLPNDISNMPYNEFMIAYKSIIKKSFNHLKTDGYACFVIGEVRNKKGNYIGFVPDTIKAFEEAGFKYYNECIYLNGLAGACLTAGRIMGISKKVKKVHQNVLVFRKV